MLLNRIEFALMNNSFRAMVQHHIEAARLLRMGGRMTGGLALEIGCGPGFGAEIIAAMFGATTVHAFDLDPRMVGLTRRRLARRGRKAHLWVGSATAIPAADCTYDAVFDFGVLHHVPDWRAALAEVHRVLKPRGRLYAEEVFEAFIGHPLVRFVLAHPRADRFDGSIFVAAMREVGLEPRDWNQAFGAFGWFIAEKPAA